MTPRGGSSDIQIGNGTLGSVVATQETSFNEKTDVIALEEDNSGDAASSEKNNQDRLSWGNEHSFDELQTLINQADAGDEINLDYDYSIASGGTTVTIDKSLTIKGNNHVLDGSNSMSIFQVKDTSDTISLVFKNIKFVNGGKKSTYDEYSNPSGGAIYHNANVQTLHSLTLINCDFEDNGVAEDGGAIYWIGGSLKIHNSTFRNNVVEQGHGGAVFFKSDVSGIEIINCNFTDNSYSSNHCIL